MKLKHLVWVVVAVAVSSGVAMAREHGQFCKADREKFCKDIKAGQGEVAKCLKEHEAELAPECKDKMSKHKEKMEQRKSACAGDRDKFCKDVEAGKGNMHKCLKSHKAELSAECAATFKKSDKKSKE